MIMVRLYKGDKLDYYLSALFILPFLFLGILVEKWRWIFSILVIFIAFRAGFDYSQRPLENDYADLQQTVSAISQRAVNRQATVLFHHADLYYPLKFAFDEAGLKIASPSATLVDVCQGWQKCDRPTLIYCQPVNGACGVLDDKQWEGYRKVEKLQLRKYQIVISEVL